MGKTRKRVASRLSSAKQTGSSIHRYECSIIYALYVRKNLQDSIKSDTSMLSIDKDSADFPPLGSLQQAAQVQSSLLIRTRLPN